MPLADWPDFQFMGKLLNTSGSPAILNAAKSQGEPLLVISDGKFRLFGQGARTQAWGIHATGCYSERSYDPANPLGGWYAAGEAAPSLIPVELSHNAEAIDTPGYVRHPISGRSLWPYEARPGTRPSGAGEIGSIQIAYLDGPPSIGASWTQDNVDRIFATETYEAGFLNLGGEWAGGDGEVSGTWRARTQKIRYFYEALTNYNPPGGQFTWSMTYADTSDGLTSIVKRAAGPFWDPSVDGNIAQSAIFQGFRGAWQPHFTVDPGDPDLVWMVGMMSDNDNGKVFMAQSPDGGETWYLHPRNPVLRTGMAGGPGSEGSLGGPSLCIDDAAGCFWIVVDGAPGARGINDIFIARANRRRARRHQRQGPPVKPVRMRPLSPRIWTKGRGPCSL